MSRMTTAETLVATINAATVASDPPIVATLDPRRAAGLAVEGVCVLVGPPRLTFDRRPPDASAVWELFVMSGHPDPVTAWRRRDDAVTVLHEAVPGLDTARAVTWQLPSGGEPTEAYLVTYPDIV